MQQQSTATLTDRDLDEIAAFLGKRPGYLMDAGNPDRKGPWSADLVGRTAAFTGNYVHLDMVCRTAGGVFVPTPKVSADYADINHHTGEILRQVADVVQSPASILADRHISDAELAENDKQVDEAITALLAYKHLLHEKHDQQTPAARVGKGA